MNEIQNLNTMTTAYKREQAAEYSNENTSEALSAFHLGKFSPAVAEQYAAMICCFWRTAQKNGKYSPGNSLDVIDLCPTEGSASLLKRSIGRRLDGIQSVDYRYLPVFSHTQIKQDSTASRSQNSFSPWPEASLLWNPQVAEALPVWLNTGASYVPSNPLIVLCHDAWCQTEQRLYAIHYGKLLRADLALLVSDDSAKSGELWQASVDTDWDSSLADVLKRYMIELNSSPIPYPSGALSIIGRLISISARPILFVSNAKGQGEELEIRLGSFSELAKEYRRSNRLPVNFQLIAHWVKAHRGASAGISLSSQQYLHINMFGVPDPDVWVRKISRCVEPSLFSGSEQLASVSHALGRTANLEARMHLLQLSRFDPAVFLASDKELVAAFSSAGEFDRKAWRSVLEQVWENRGACPHEESFHRRLATAAMYCGHWGFARHVLHEGMQRFAVNATDVAHLAWCDVRTGRLTRGESLVKQALTLDKDNPLAHQVAARLTDRLQARDEFWRTSLQHDQLPIVLEPLEEPHLEAYFHQYRDPQIAVMTGLPALNSMDDARKWFASQAQEPGKVNFAIMHEDWGFVGFINLAVSEHAAFFCFWIGVDFQGLGISSAAGRLVCRYAALQGVPVMLTSAYKDNHRSIRALKRIGFCELSTRALPPDQDRIFFSLIDDSLEAVDSHVELVNYYRREKLPMEFAEPPDSLFTDIQQSQRSL
jgi:RimJ/RimL family protein N-acetyltransferase